ncbi:hypothetical protein GCM10009836_47820 [Pseudonocardia ailaonensis]|uniref:DUF3052 domain-containing protein n=1 Tax=Pseudonocardia ailaonensis TaxID=367279 RepID=A0ABN2ND14_9PSEU
MTGYSGTPLAKKLGIRAGFALIGAPSGWEIPDLPPEAEPAEATDAGVVVAFCPDRAALAGVLDDLAAAVFPDRALWIAWPRKAGGHISDLDENGIREHALPVGLVDVKVAALDQDWSGLKLVWRKELRVVAATRKA